MLSIEKITQLAKENSTPLYIFDKDELADRISSIKRISPSFKLFSTAAISPGRSIAGPEVVLIFTSISFAMIFESVVFPNPGGPYKSTWSSASFLCFAASINTRIFSFTLSCPI